MKLDGAEFAFFPRRERDRGKNVTVLHHWVLHPTGLPILTPLTPTSSGSDPHVPARTRGSQLRLPFPAHHQHVVSRVINLHGDETQPDVRLREATGEAACLAQPPPPEPAAC